MNKHILYLSILVENYVDSQIPQNRMRIIKIPAVVHVPIFVLSYDASAKSRNACIRVDFTLTLHTCSTFCATSVYTSLCYKCVTRHKIIHTQIFHRQS